jgi:hypothetical protein
MSPCSPVSSGEAAHCIKAAADMSLPDSLPRNSGNMTARITQIPKLTVRGFARHRSKQKAKVRTVVPSWAG